MANSCAAQVKGKRVLAICDTSTINTNAKVGRITDFDGLGIVSRNQNKESIGFFIHPIYVEDEQDGTPYGLANVEVYNRSMERSTFDKSKRDVLRTIPIEEKESYKWVGPCIQTRDSVLQQAAHVTYVADREGDIIEVFEQIPNAQADVVVRNMHNRKIINDSEEHLRLHDQLKAQEVSGRYTIKLEKNKKATIEIKWGNCQLLAPRGYRLDKPINASYVEVKEILKSGEVKENPIHWILLSSREISDIEQAKEIVKIYGRRWQIEIFFKLLKSDGYHIEKTELETGKAIRKLTLLVMQASIRLLQLKAARTGGTELMVTEVFTKEEIICLIVLNGKLQGNTAKQQNPYPREHLSWATWIIARLGGWTEYYNKRRPPGNKTLGYGLRRFDSIMFGYSLTG